MLVPFLVRPVSASPHVTLYQDCNYGGQSWTFDTNVPGFNSGLNDQISSLKVESGWVVRLFQDINYGGRAQDFTANTPCLVGSYIGNDQASSLTLSSYTPSATHYLISSTSDWAQLDFTGPETFACNGAYITSGVGLGGNVICTGTYIRVTDSPCGSTCPTVTADVALTFYSFRGGDSMVDHLMTKGDKGSFYAEIQINGNPIAHRTDGWVIGNGYNDLKFSVPSYAYSNPDITAVMTYFVKTQSDWTKLILTGPQWWSGISWSIMRNSQAPGLSISASSNTLSISKTSGDQTEVWVQFTATIHSLTVGDADPNANQFSGVGYSIQKGSLQWTMVDFYQSSPTPWQTRILSYTDNQQYQPPNNPANFNVRSNDHIFLTGISGAFYYPWYGGSSNGYRHWIQDNHNPPSTWASNYLSDYNDAFAPTTNLYDSQDFSADLWQIGSMRMAMVDVAISSWWGTTSYEDQAFKQIIGDSFGGVTQPVMDRPDNPYPSLKWAVMDEKPWYNPNLTSDAVYGDLSYIVQHYGSSPHYLRIDGKPVIFVFGMSNNDLSAFLTAKSSLAANGMPVFLNIYPNQYFSGSNCGGGGCINVNSDSALRVADAYFDYNGNFFSRVTTSCDAVFNGCPYTSDSPSGQSETIHVGYDEYPEYCNSNLGLYKIVTTCNPLPRNANDYATGWSGMVSARDQYRFQLVNTWNEYHEGSMMEPARSIQHIESGFQDGGLDYFQGFVTLNRAGVSSYKLGYPVVDTTPPTVTLTAMQSVTRTPFNVQWTASDDSGSVYVDVQYEDSTAGGLWTYLVTGSSQTSASFSGTCGHLYLFRAQARDGSGNTRIFPSGSETSTVAGCNLAQFVSQTPPPTTMQVGQMATVSIVFRNTGSLTWNPDPATNPYRLGSQNPQDNTNWGNIVYIPQIGLTTSRVMLSRQVPPGDQYNFTFTVTAPSTPGTYNFQWRMVNELIEWFGDYSPSVSITVLGARTLSNNPSSADWGNRVGNWAVVNGYLDGSGTSAQIVSANSFGSNRTVTVTAKTVTPGSQPWYTAWIRAKYTSNCNAVTLILDNGPTLALDLSVVSGPSCVANHYTMNTNLAPVTSWHTITMVIAGNEVKVYVDGILYIDATDPGVGTLGADNLALASWGPSESQFDTIRIS